MCLTVAMGILTIVGKFCADLRLDKNNKNKNDLDCLLSLAGTMNTLAPCSGAISGSALWVPKARLNPLICRRGYRFKATGFRPALAQRPTAGRQLSPLSDVPILKPGDWRRPSSGRPPLVYPNINSLSVACTVLPNLSDE